MGQVRRAHTNTLTRLARPAEASVFVKGCKFDYQIGTVVYENATEWRGQMSFRSETYSLLIISPSDLVEERDVATEAVYDWNAQDVRR